jgi:hypothetical protein
MTLIFLYSIDFLICSVFDEPPFILKLKLDDSKLNAGKNADSKILPILFQGVYITLIAIPFISLIIGGTYSFSKKLNHIIVCKK